MDGESLLKARKEMIRADHLLYVSLKYSRTVDVIQSVIARLVDAMDMGIVAILEILYNEEELEPVLHGSKTKTDALLAKLPEMAEYINFYLFLRKIMKAPVLGKLNEFRRHVTFVTKVDDRDLNIKIETCEEYYHKVQNFMKLVHLRIHKTEESVYRH